MSRLPQVSGKEVVKALEKLGYLVDIQHGSHIILRHQAPPYRRITVPNHRTIAKGTLRSIIREVGLSVDAFQTLL